MAGETLCRSYFPYVEEPIVRLSSKTKPIRCCGNSRAGPGLRVNSGYQAVVNGALMDFTHVSRPTRASRSRGTEAPSRLPRSPSSTSCSEVYRNSSTTACGQLLFRCRSDLIVFEGYVVEQRQPLDGKDGGRFSGPFRAYYFQCARNFGSSSSSFRLEKLLSIGTAESQLLRYETILADLKEHDVTEVCGKKVDAAFDVKAALTDLSVVQRQALSTSTSATPPASSTTSSSSKSSPTSCSDLKLTSSRRPST